MDKADLYCISAVYQALPGGGDMNSVEKTQRSGADEFLSQTCLGFESWLTPLLVAFVSRCHDNAP